jgi:hypothetical protein
MPTDVAFLVASLTGFFGALVVTGIGVRFTRNLRALACSGIFSGAALGALTYVLCGWFTHGFLLFQLSVPLLAGLILLLVMTAQNWFVFYEDRRDVLQSSRPALVMLAAAIAAALARIVAGQQSILSPLIWAGAGSLAMLWCVDPVQRSIERSRSVFAGTLLGLGKVLIPLTGVVLFLRRVDAPLADRARADDPALAVEDKGFLLNLLCLVYDLGQLLLLILMNGARIPQRAAAADPLDMLGKQKNTPSITGEMSPLKRDSVVMIFVLALHVLCGVVLAKS